MSPEGLKINEDAITQLPPASQTLGSIQSMEGQLSPDLPVLKLELWNKNDFCPV